MISSALAILADLVQTNTWTKSRLLCAGTTSTCSTTTGMLQSSLLLQLKCAATPQQVLQGPPLAVYRVPGACRGLRARHTAYKTA